MIDLSRWLRQSGFGKINQRESLSGGDCAKAERIRTASGENFCVKQKTDAPSDFFKAEHHGLNALAAAQTQSQSPLTIPRVFGSGSDFIVLEYLPPSDRRADYWQHLGHGLAAMHCLPVPHFGFDRHNYCGTTPQFNTPESDGFSFFKRQRLVPQVDRALDNGLLTNSEVDCLRRLSDKLPQLIPEQGASLIHGDLWSGNLLVDTSGCPALIDPAAHYGWAEAELAMTHLFGGFPERFYRAYEEVNPLQSGWQTRVELYNLYHLLNHLNMFGGSYHSQVMAIARRYC